METNGVIITTTNTTNEEVKLTTTSPDSSIETLRQQIDALTRTVQALAERASTVKEAEAEDVTDEATDTDTGTSEAGVVTDGDDVEPVVVFETATKPDEHGFVESTVGVVRPDAPEPEPVVDEQSVPDYEAEAQNGMGINAMGVDPNNHPRFVNGVRPAEDTNTHYSRGRYNQRVATNNILAALAAQAKYIVANGMNTGLVGLVIHDKSDVMVSLTDWIAHTTNYVMTTAQVRTAVKRLEQRGYVYASGKRGKQTVYRINPTGPMSGYLTN